MGYLAETKCRVIIAGQDVTSRFDPHLLSLKVSRSGKSASDETDIDLADPDGSIVLPQKRSPVEITVGGVSAFSGFVADVDYDFSEGRKLTVSASSVDQGSKVKEPAMRHKDDASFSDVAKEWGAKVGLTVSVAGTIASVERAYWLSQNESFMSWGNRIAAEIGASFKIQGSKAYFVGINEGLSGSGKALRPVTAAWGVNLLGGSISPIISRPKFKNVKISYFDIAKGEHTEVDVPTGIDDVDAALRTAITSADESQSKQKGKAIGKNSDREKGSGSVSILGAIYAEPEAMLMLSGVRPGIDGSYRISSVDHEIGSSGFRTNCTLKQPQDGAGVDSR
jgi:phage protein D